jgi:hypothetical protein
MNLNRLHPKRLIPGIKRRLKEKYYDKTWLSSIEGDKNRQFLESIKNKFLGHRLFLIANGPSLKEMDLSVLENEYTMCMNRFYISFDKIGFTPNFLVCVEDLVLSQFGNDFDKLNLEGKFVNWRANNEIKNSHYLKESFALEPFFQNDLTKPTHFGGTVTFACLQLAYYMGFQEVIIIGLDHRFKESGIPNKVETRKSEKDESHFDPNYFPKGMKWRLPDLEKSELSYKIALDYYVANGRRIFDATIDGQCSVFPKIDFDSSLASNKSH